MSKDYILPDNNINLENILKVDIKDIKFIKINKRRLHPREEEEYPYDGIIEYQNKLYYFKVNNEWFDGYTYVAYWDSQPAFAFSIDVGEISFNKNDDDEIDFFNLSKYRDPEDY